MQFTNLITKEYVSENVRPFSGNDALFNACVRESILFDSGLPRLLANKLLTDEIIDLDENFIDELRLILAYFTYSRAIRTSTSTITKYGYTTKNSENSFPADTEKIQSDSIYYKNCGEKLIEGLKCKYKEIYDNWETPLIPRVKDTYLKCSIIGD